MKWTLITSIRVNHNKGTALERPVMNKLRIKILFFNLHDVMKTMGEIKFQEARSFIDYHCLHQIMKVEILIFTLYFQIVFHCYS